MMERLPLLVPRRWLEGHNATVAYYSLCYGAPSFHLNFASISAPVWLLTALTLLKRSCLLGLDHGSAGVRGPPRFVLDGFGELSQLKVELG